MGSAIIGDVDVRAIRWLGVQTDRFAEMRSFALDILGLRLVTESDDFLVADAANGDRVEVFGPCGPQPAEQFASNRVVVGFLVDDIRTARAELGRSKGVICSAASR